MNTAKKVIKLYTQMYLLTRYEHKIKTIVFYDCTEPFNEDFEYTHKIMFQPKSYFKKAFYRDDNVYNPEPLMTSEIIQKYEFSTTKGKMDMWKGRAWFKYTDILNHISDNKKTMTALVKEPGVANIILSYKNDLDIRTLQKLYDNYDKYQKELCDIYSYCNIDDVAFQIGCFLVENTCDYDDDDDFEPACGCCVINF